MVSGPDSSDRAVLPRHGTSIASHVSSRRSRHRRVASQGLQNEFPVFSTTGDVEIIIKAGKHEKRYLLHRLILAQNSGFFDASTGDDWTRAANGTGSELSRIAESSESLSRQPSGGSKMRWRYELDVGEDQAEIPMLVQKPMSSSLFGGESSGPPPTPRNKPTAPHSGFFRSVGANISSMNVKTTNFPVDSAEELLMHYDNLFRIFYNHSPTLDRDNIAGAYCECKALLNLADMYDALDVVGPRVDHHLLMFRGLLWKQIAKYPPSYLKLGYQSRSKAIFAESLIHVVGQWPANSAYLRQHLPENVIEIIEDKVADLEEKVAATECRLFKLALTTAAGERVSPANAYLEWAATSLFRDWLAKSLVSGSVSQPAGSTRQDGPDSTPSSAASASGRHPSGLTGRSSNGIPTTGRVFRTIGIGGSQDYLSRDVLKRFLKAPPHEYSRDNLRKLEKSVENLKSMARGIVQPLLKSGLEADVGRGELSYLTCIGVRREDLPWD